MRMKPIERILLMTNLAPHSDRAMERAVQLAAQSGAELTALYVVQPSDGQPLSPYDRLPAREIEAEIRRHLMSVPLAASVVPFVTVTEGTLEDAARSFAEWWGPDLMVAGVHRSNGLSDLFSVSTVERISTASTAPLLVVRNKPFAPYVNTMVPVDFLDASRTSVEMALALVQEGSLHLLHVFDVPGTMNAMVPPVSDGFKAEFAALLDGHQIGRRVVATNVRHGGAMREIIDAAYVERPDLIVMGTQGRSGIERVLLGSTAHDVLEHLPSDVLLVKAP